MLVQLNCRVCGGELKEEGTYKCAHCGHTFVKKAENDYAEKLKDLLKEEKYEKVSAARLNLWSAMHEEYVSSEACVTYARELKALVPSDYYANFSEIANSKGDAEISACLNSSSKNDMEIYADAVLDFMTKSMTAGTTTAVCGYIDRAFANKTSPEYTKYVNLYEKEAEKVNAGIYELTIPRDVFLAYSSADMPKVMELCEYLEDQEVSCFLAMRNLRHGKGAADNYDRALKIAMDNCRIILYVSSDNSRKIGCDAYRIELPYVRRRDMDGAPSEYRNGSYEKLPSVYKKNRIEYLLDDYRGAPTDKAVREFFSGYEWCRTKEDVAERVITYLTSEPEPVPDDGEKHVFEEPDSVVLPPYEEKSEISRKENNVLNQVKRLISAGEYGEARERVNALEKDEQEATGVCTAAVYYYKILIENGVSSEERLIDRLVSRKASLAEDRNFRLAKSCDDSPEKTKLLEIEERIKCGIRENERMAREEEKRREEAEEQALERQAAMRQEAAERRRASRQVSRESEAEYRYSVMHGSDKSLRRGRTLHLGVTRAAPVIFVLVAVLLLVAGITMNYYGGTGLPDAKFTFWEDDYRFLGVLSVVDLVIAVPLCVFCFIQGGRRMGAIHLYETIGIIEILCMIALLVSACCVYIDIADYYRYLPVYIEPGPALTCFIAATASCVAATVVLMATSAVLRKKCPGYEKAAEHEEQRYKRIWY